MYKDTALRLNKAKDDQNRTSNKKALGFLAYFEPLC